MKPEADEQVYEIARQLIPIFGEHLGSLLYYPHPFTEGGFVAVLSDKTASIVDCLSKAYACVPPSYSLHCLRRAELSELSLPVYSRPDVVNNYMHTAFWLKHKGVLLYGLDVRDEVKLPANRRVLLDVNIELCMHLQRMNIILNWLRRKDYSALFKKLDSQIRYLMAAALLVRNDWDVTFETIPERFARAYKDEQMERIWTAFKSCTRMAEADSADETQCRQYAFESAWLFECFLRRLREYVRDEDDARGL